MDHEAPELIEDQMHQTRESLTEKVATLEQTVVGTLQSAQSAVEDTVHTVKSAVQDTLDISRHIRDNPWTFVAGAAVVGFVTGALSKGVAGHAANGSAAHPVQPAFPPPVPRERRPSWVDDLWEMVGHEVKKLGEAAIASASAALKQSLDREIPRFVEGVTSEPGAR